MQYKKNIYYNILENQLFVLSDLINNIFKKLNFGDILRAKKSLINQIFSKIILLDSQYQFIVAYSIFEFLNSIFNAFINKSWFIYSN